MPGFDVLDVWLLSLIFLKILLYTSSLLACGSMLFIVMVRPEDSELEQRLLSVAMIFALIGLVTTGVQTVLQSGQLLDEGISGIFDGYMLVILLQGPLGASSFARGLGLVLLIITVIIPSLRILLIPLGAIYVALSFGLIGHATKNPNLLGPLITVHILAISYWIGGLLPLHRLARRPETMKIAAHLAITFGRQAMIIIPFLIASGLIVAYCLLESLQALYGTSYGRLLIAKIIAVSLLLALGAMNKLYWVPRLMNGDSKAAETLRASIRWEAFAFLIIFAITATLTSALHLPE